MQSIGLLLHFPIIPLPCSCRSPPPIPALSALWLGWRSSVLERICWIISPECSWDSAQPSRCVSLKHFCHQKGNSSMLQRKCDCQVSECQNALPLPSLCVSGLWGIFWDVQKPHSTVNSGTEKFSSLNQFYAKRYILRVWLLWTWRSKVKLAN